jgi:hypothetical protein
LDSLVNCSIKQHPRQLEKLSDPLLKSKLPFLELFCLLFFINSRIVLIVRIVIFFKIAGVVYGFFSHLHLAVFQPDLWIDSQGERFCDEGITFYDTTIGNASVRPKDGRTYSIFDSSIKQYLIEKGIDRAMTMDFPPGSRLPELDQELEAALEDQHTAVFKANSIQELAVKIGVNPVTLQTTVEEYNRSCEKVYFDIMPLVN